MPNLLLNLLLIFVSASFVAAETATSLTKDGVTWTFSKAETVGYYCNGDRWVVGPVTIVSISPADENPGDAWKKHGTALNPPPNTLNQGQGFDSSMNTGTWYANSRNVAPANTGQPLVVSPGNSVVSAISVANQVSGFNAIRFERMVTLTVVQQPPATLQGAWFRPPPCGTDKAFRWNTAENLSKSLLQNKAIPADAKSIAEVLGYFAFPWMAIAEGDSVQGMSPRTMPNYGRDAGNLLSHGLLSLHLDYPNDQKQLLYIRLVQYGIDIYGAMKAGMVCRGAGGLDNGRKAAMVLAGLALNDPEIKEWSDASKHLVFAEDKQTFFVQQWNVDQPRIAPPNTPDSNGNYYEPYTSAMIGTPEWGVYHSVESNKDSSGWANCSYRFIGGSQVGHALWAHLTPGAVAAWNHRAFFEYEDRYFTHEDTYHTWPNGSTNGIPKFVYNMWKAYRDGGTPVIPPTVNFSVNDRIKVWRDTRVRGSASLSGELLGIQNTNAEGTIKDGPREMDNIVWWYIDYDNGSPGWSGEDNFEKLGNPPSKPAPPRVE